MPAFNAEHVSEWYPVAEILTEGQRLAQQIAADHGATALGMVLLTWIPPGHQVYPHIDGGWHAGHYEKFALQVRGGREQIFHVEDEQLVTEDGDLFWFDNSQPHWVKNNSGHDRMTLIVCIRRP